MRDPVRIELQPLGHSIEVERGTELRDVLYAYGVEFPCGGRGRCRRCRVRLVRGSLATSAEESAVVSAREVAQDWRLACRARAEAPLTLEVEQFDAPILVDHTPFAFKPRAGHGVAVDLGTTTLVAQLLDLENGRVLAAGTALNPQAAFGSDIVSRIQYALKEEGRRRLTALVREAVEKLAREAVAVVGLGHAPLQTVVLVGNTVMHHLFCGLDVAPLAALPFRSDRLGLQEFRGGELGWQLGGNPLVRFLPCLGGFVGSDLLAGVLAVRVHESREPAALVDLGTNGEIVVGTAERMLCASTAAGPAFEAGGIEMGMQATTGAIDRVTASDAGLECRVLGGGTARGICGSGLVDAVAAGLDLGWIEPGGRLADGRAILQLCGGVHLTQADIRRLQLAKAAVAAALEILQARLGTPAVSPPRVSLAGAFGNYVSHRSAHRIGLLDCAEQRVESVGNTALLGAKLALFAPEPQAGDLRELRARIEHVGLAEDPGFQAAYRRPASRGSAGDPFQGRLAHFSSFC